MDGISVEIRPVPKPRMTGKSAIYSDTAKRYYSWKDELNLLVGNFRCGHELSLVFTMPMPKSWSKAKRAAMDTTPHQQKPDIDNLIKAVLDALYEDDSCVWNISAAKFWGTEGQIQIINLVNVDAQEV